MEEARHIRLSGRHSLDTAHHVPVRIPRKSVEKDTNGKGSDHAFGLIKKLIGSFARAVELAQPVRMTRDMASCHTRECEVDQRP